MNTTPPVVQPQEAAQELRQYAEAHIYSEQDLRRNTIDALAGKSQRERVVYRIFEFEGVPMKACFTINKSEGRLIHLLSLYPLELNGRLDPVLCRSAAEAFFAGRGEFLEIPADFFVPIRGHRAHPKFALVTNP